MEHDPALDIEIDPIVYVRLPKLIIPDLCHEVKIFS